tara:strand:- start:127 stop:426 length:300 start_codon:yes stop_codon:yes gene_type:complete
MIIPDDIYIDLKSLKRGEIVIVKERRIDKSGNPLTHKFVDSDIIMDIVNDAVRIAEDKAYHKGYIECTREIERDKGVSISYSNIESDNEEDYYVDSYMA